MSFKQKYISDKELEKLEAFLLDRFDDEEEHPDKDEGIIDLSELDGFFAAIVSAPEMILPSVWMPALWGDFTPNWKSSKEAEKIMGLLISIMNSINSEFMDSNSQYQPMFEHRESGDIEHVIVEEWCFGYMRGVALWQESKDLKSLGIRILLAPIQAFGSYKGLDSIDNMSDIEVANIKEKIVPNVLEIFQFWRNNQNGNNAGSNIISDKVSAIETFKRENDKVGRNDPCPCGSGKKYKKCCLH